MKPLAIILLFGAALYGAIKLGKHIGRKRDPNRKEWEPSNTKEDSHDNPFFL